MFDNAICFNLSVINILAIVLIIIISLLMFDLHDRGTRLKYSNYVTDYSHC